MPATLWKLPNHVLICSSICNYKIWWRNMKRLPYETFRLQTYTLTKSLCAVTVHYYWFIVYILTRRCQLKFHVYPPKYKIRYYSNVRDSPLFLTNFCPSVFLYQLAQEIQVKCRYKCMEIIYNFPRYKMSLPIKGSLQWIYSSECWMSAVIRSVTFFLYQLTSGP